MLSYAPFAESFMPLRLPSVIHALEHLIIELSSSTNATFCCQMISRPHLVHCTDPDVLRKPSSALTACS